MGAIFVGLIYLGVALAALHFIGRTVFQILALRVPPNAGLFTALGIAAFIAFCGLLEYSQLASGPFFLVFLAIGAAGQFVSAVKAKTRVREILVAFQSGSFAAIASFGIFGVLYAAFLINATIWHYQFLDDLHGYLVFPERILEEGSIGRDPFNFRRIETGLTGGAYLYALFRSGLDISQTRLADVGIGSACLLMLVYGWARERKVMGVRLAIVLLVTLAVVAFSPIINNTPESVGKALLFAMLWLAFLFDGRSLSVSRAICLGLMFFACVGLKTTYLPEACAIIAAYYVSALFERALGAVAANAAAFGITALVLMLPWMIVSHGIANTFWYPLFGTGILSADETAGVASVGKLISDGGRVMCLLLPACIGAYMAWSDPEQQSRRIFHLAIIGCSIVFVFLSQLKFTAFGYRYGHAGAAAVMLFFLPIILQRRVGIASRKLAFGAVLFCILIMVQSKTTLDRWLTDGLLYRREVTQSQALVDQAKQYDTLQKAVPAGEPLLALMSSPSLLDFHRNPIAVMDHAGKMGPGKMPSPDDAPEWARYLKSLGFHYVAYSYGDEGGYDSRWARHIIRDFSHDESYSRFMVGEARASIQMRQTFVAFRKIGRLVFDDGKEFVVYLP